MKLYSGTSGYSYKEWKGVFYPEKIPQAEMLSFYSSRLKTVEINNTFYRMPKKSNLEDWSAQVHEGFRFVFKASQKITHRKRLKECDEEMEFLTGNLQTMGSKLGCMLIQLPPNLKKDIERLKTFLPLIPSNIPAAFEFRNDSWLDNEVYRLLETGNHALVLAETDEAPEVEFVKTADWGYLRLRRTSYSEEELQQRLEKIKAQKWNLVYVFFKHEDEGTGPRLAQQFNQMAGL